MAYHGDAEVWNSIIVVLVCFLWQLCVLVDFSSIFNSSSFDVFSYLWSVLLCTVMNDSVWIVHLGERCASEKFGIIPSWARGCTWCTPMGILGLV